MASEGGSDSAKGVVTVPLWPVSRGDTKKAAIDDSVTIWVSAIGGEGAAPSFTKPHVLAFEEGVYSGLDEPRKAPKYIRKTGLRAGKASERVGRPIKRNHSSRSTMNEQPSSTEGSDMSDDKVSYREFETRMSSIEDRINVRFEAFSKQVERMIGDVEKVEARTDSRLAEVVSEVKADSRTTRGIIIGAVLTILFGVGGLVQWGNNQIDGKNALRIEAAAEKSNTQLDKLAGQISALQINQQQQSKTLGEIQESLKSSQKNNPKKK